MSLVRNERNAEDIYNIKDKNGNNISINGETEFLIEHAGEQAVIAAGDPMDKAWTASMWGEIVASGIVTAPVPSALLVTPQDFGLGSYQLIFYNFTSNNNVGLVAGATSDGRILKINSATNISTIFLNSTLNTSDKLFSRKVNIEANEVRTFMKHDYYSNEINTAAFISEELYNVTNNDTSIYVNFNISGSVEWQLIKFTL